MSTGTKKKAPVNLSEYAQERMPFDAVIRTLGKIKQSAPTKAKPAKDSKSKGANP